MQRRNLVIIGVALLVGLLAVYLLNAYFSGVERREERMAQEQELARIVVAGQDLEFGSPLTTSNIKLVNWPASSVPAGAFSSVDTALKNGRVALRPILAGEPILSERVSGKSGRASISYNIPEGMRAAAIPVESVTSVSGFVRPGDVVDVLLTRQAPGGNDNIRMTDVLLPNVQVLAIDRAASIKNTTPKVGKTAVLLVDLMGAQVLTLAREVGTMSLILRNIENQEFDATRFAGARPYVTTKDINRGRPRFRGASSGPKPRVVSAARPTRTSAQPSNRARGAPSMTIIRGTSPTQYQVVPNGRW